MQFNYSIYTNFIIYLNFISCICFYFKLFIILTFIPITIKLNYKTNNNFDIKKNLKSNNIIIKYFIIKTKCDCYFL